MSQDSQHHGMNDLPGLGAYCGPGQHEEHPEGRFGRMFPHLPANHVPADLLAEIGKADGPMDGGTRADRTATVPVGHVIFGQFIDHDITLDVTTSLDRTVQGALVPNVRTPTLDLDCVYGEGPEAHRYLHADDDARLLTGADQPGATVEQRNDLLRAPVTDRAIIGDFRNDENRIVSQLQLGMIKFHNASCDAIAADKGYSGKQLYEAARKRVTWHYQWCVIYDFLVAMCGRSVVDDILANGRKLYCHVRRPYIPVEFSVAAYRFGHSMVPQKIQIQSGKPAHPFFGNKLGKGFTKLPSVDAIVDWNELFGSGDTVQLAEKFDTKMAKLLLELPFVKAPAERSLATRNLLRGNAYRLPSGEQVASVMLEREVDGFHQGLVTPVTDRVREISEVAVAGTGVSPMTGDGSPLWLYLLAEGEIIGRADGIGGHDPGEGLGPVGARIVAEVLIGLIELDDRSFFGENGNWVPDPGLRTIGDILASTNSSDLP